MKKRNKIVAILLVLVMVTGVFAVAPVSVGAAKTETESVGAKTQAEALAWLKNKADNHISLDYDGQYGAQCVDLVAYYLDYLGMTSLIGGNANNYVTKTMPAGSGWVRYSYSSGFVPKPGDICVWDANVSPAPGWNATGSAGHIGVVYSVGSSTFTSVEQNVNKKQYCHYIENRPFSYVSAYIRPAFNATSYVDLGTAFNANIVCTSNTSLAVTANDSDNVYIATKANNDAQKWYFERDTDKSYRLTNVGRNKCLDVTGAATADGTNIQVYTNNNRTAQRWYFVKDGSGYTMVPKNATSSAMDIKDGTIANGTNIWLYTRNQSNAQRFSVVKINSYNIAYNANGGTGTMASGKVDANAKLTIPQCAFTRESYQFGGYNVYRNSDKTWYVDGQGWITDAAIGNGGYTKKVYQAGASYTFTNAWTSGVANGATFTFYPIWIPEHPTLHYYLNYSGCNYMLGSDLGENYSNYIQSRDTSVYTLSVDESTQLNNQKSLKISAASAGASGKDMLFATNTNAGRYAGGNGIFDETGDNRTFTLSFWAKGTVNGAKMFFRWGYTSNFQSVTLTKDWQYYSIPMNKNINCGKHMHPYIDQAGTFWLNNISLTPGTDSAANNYRHETECVPVNQAYTLGEKYTPLPAPEREGYTFLGWYTMTVGGTLITEDTKVANCNISVYAHWQKNVSDEPAKVMMHNGKRYELYDNNMTWEDAKAFCESKGGHLATISDKTENDVVASMIADKHCTIWLGAKLNANTNVWEWVTGEGFNYSNWAPFAPSSVQNSFYLQMISFDARTESTAGYWNDEPISNNIKNLYSIENCVFVCEYDYALGDVNCDGEVSVQDVSRLQRHLAEFAATETYNEKFADMNGDGKINIKDVTAMQRKLAELE